MSRRTKTQGAGVRVVRNGAAAVALSTLGMSGACGTRIERPDDTVRAYVDAVRGGEWGRAYRLLEPEAREGMSIEQYREYCDQHAELVRERADAIEDAMRRGEARVVADVPLDRVRAVSLEHVDDAWFLTEAAPLVSGSESPVASMLALASVLDSDGVTQLLTLLSDDMRARYVAEIDALVDALAAAGTSDVTVHGDRATIEVGEITIHLVREEGAWHLADVEQPYSYDDNYYYDW